MTFRMIMAGAAAMSSITIVRMLAQILVVPFLARYLSPDDYGLIGMAMPIIFFIMVFADAGLPASLVRQQNQARNPAEWSCVFWLLVLAGLGLCVLTAALAPIIAYTASEPRLFYPLLALASVILVQSIATVPGAVLQHEKRFTTIARIEMTAMMLGILTAFLVAWQGGGVWALILQQIVYYGVKLVLLLAITRFVPMLVWNRDVLRPHVHFGKNLLGSNILGAAMPMIYNFIIGHTLGVIAVGFVTMAQLFSTLPARVVTGPLQFVLYPYFAGLESTPDQLRRNFMLISRLIGLAIIPVMGMAAVAHDPVFRLLLSDKWQTAGVVFMILAPAATIQTVLGLRHTLTVALGRTDLLMRQTVEGALLVCVILAVMAPFGVAYAAAAFSVAAMMYAPRGLMLILPLIGVRVRDYLGLFTTPVTVTAIGMGVYYTLTTAHDFSLITQFIMAVLIGVAIMAVLAAIYRRPLRQEMHNLKAAPTAAPIPSLESEA